MVRLFTEHGAPTNPVHDKHLSIDAFLVCRPGHQAWPAKLQFDHKDTRAQRGEWEFLSKTIGSHPVTGSGFRFRICHQSAAGVTDIARLDRVSGPN